MTLPQLPPLPARAFADLIEALPVAAAVCDAGGNIIRVNPALLAHIGQDGAYWYGRPFAELPLTPCGTSRDGAELFTLTDASGHTERLARTRMTFSGEGPASLAIHFLMPHTPLAADSLHPLAAIGGRIQGVDRESGLLERTAVANVLHGEVARCRRYGNPLALVLLHLQRAGGEALAYSDALSPPAIVGQLLAEQTRWADSVGRWSKERFVLILPETGPDAAARLVDKIRNSVEGLRTDGIELGVELAASAWCRGDDARSMLKRAEAELDEKQAPMREVG